MSAATREKQTAREIRAEYHLTLGTLIALIHKTKAITPARVWFSDGSPPLSFDSYRGHPEDLALGMGEFPVSLQLFAAHCKWALGRQFQPYSPLQHGLTMDARTPLWQASWGSVKGEPITEAQFDLRTGDLILYTQLDYQGTPI